MAHAIGTHSKIAPFTLVQCARGYSSESSFLQPLRLLKDSIFVHKGKAVSATCNIMHSCLGIILLEYKGIRWAIPDSLQSLPILSSSRIHYNKFNGNEMIGRKLLDGVNKGHNIATYRDGEYRSSDYNLCISYGHQFEAYLLLIQLYVQ